MKRLGLIIFIIAIVVGAYGAYQISVKQEDNYTQLLNEYHEQRDIFNEYAMKADELGMLKNELFLEKMMQLGNNIGECERKLNIHSKGISNKEYKQIIAIIDGNKDDVDEVIETIDNYEKKTGGKK